MGYIEKSICAEKSDIEKINQFTRSEFDADSLYIFNIVLCDNDIDRDFEKFSPSTLEQLKNMFIGKTGIFDHSMKAGDQKARIFDTWVERVNGKKTADGEQYFQLKAKAYMVKSDENLPLITEIEAGIKKEVSVSCSVKKSICSVCKNDKKQSACGHIAGREYNGKTAYSVLEDACDAYEFSFVAVPAQKAAGVTKAFSGSKEGLNMTDIIKNLKACEDEIVLSKAQATKIADRLDELEEEAQLGREYKKGLTKEVILLCTKAMPSMDIAAFSSVAQVMTTKELLAFKKAFSKTQYDKNASVQLKTEKHGGNVNQFKI